MLRELWFILIAVLFSGYFLLEGFDYGVGMLLPFVARDETDRRVALGTLGPVWDGNEVWLLVAGGASFAAFPEWYASLFSGFYLPLFLLLVGLILRGISVEYRHKAATAAGRAWCDRGIVVGSLLPALLIGVTFADLMRGLVLDRGHVVTGGFFDLLTPYGLLGGVVTVSLFALHGAVFLTLKAGGPVRIRAAGIARRLGPVALAALVVLLGWTVVAGRGSWASAVVSLLVVGCVALAVVGVRRGRDGWAFVASAVATVGLVAVYFLALHPDLMPARNDPALSLTINNASSSNYTLTVMTWVAGFLTPIVLAYQAWTYWVFRARLTGEPVKVPVLRPPAQRAPADDIRIPS